MFAIGGNTYRSQRNKFQFNDSLTQVLGIVKTARNHAIASRGHWNGATTEIPKEGYGVYIERYAHPAGGGKFSGKLVLFANTSVAGDNINKYDSNEGFEEEYVMPNDTEFISLTGDGAPIAQAVIFFRPPLADVTITDNTATPNEITDLTIELKRFGAPASSPGKIIRINKIAGFPEIEL